MNYTEYLTLPLFPLGTTLYPSGILSLKIFEVRYLDMIKTCVQEKTPFGIVTLDQGEEVRTPNEKISFARIGTFANIIHFDAIQPSLLLFVVVNAKRMVFGLQMLRQWMTMSLCQFHQSCKLQVIHWSKLSNP